MNEKNRKITTLRIAFLTALLTLMLILGGLATLNVSFALGGNYYICYERDDYRVRAGNVLSFDGSTYSVSPYMSRGDKFLISDNGGKLWGDAKGQPVTITESGLKRYTVRFSPDTELSVGSYVKVEDYKPASFTVKSGSITLGEMNWFEAKPEREEYWFHADFVGGEVVTVTGENGSRYGEYGIDTDGVTVPLAGSYRIGFTADGENLFDDDKYIKVEQLPELYLLCEENGFERNEDYRLTRDESTALYARYKTEITASSKDCEITYSVLDSSADKEYKPSESGKITVKDKGDYYVYYSPEHVYSASGDGLYYTALERKEEYYDGWYLLGDFNGFTFLRDDSAFDEKYKLVKNDETAYDEYKLTFAVDKSELSRFDGKVEFYISDGASIYRKVNGKNIEISESGEYEIVFSPTHDYGRGYRYRYTRVADTEQTQTVVISTADELSEMLANCTSPEYSLNKKFELACDVDLSGREITPALVFAGEFDGLYRTVKGVKNPSEREGSLFREVTDGGVIRRVGVQLSFVGNDRNTALVGKNSGVLENVTVYGSVRGDGYVASLAAVNASGGKINDCKSYAEVVGVMNVGGIVGFNAGEIKNSVNYGGVNTVALTGSDSASMLNVGGIVGYSTGNILACENNGAVGCRQGRYVGGIVGLSSGGLFACINNGEIAGAQNVGGIVGYYGRFSSNEGGGGIGDYLTGGRFEEWLDEYFGNGGNGSFEESEDNGVHEVYYCINYGAVFADECAGGIAGHAGAGRLKVLGCVSVGDISSRGGKAGGIIGEIGECTVSGSLSYGDVVASRNYAGGIVGEGGGTVIDCQSSAYVKARDYAGGIVGLSSGRVKGCVSYTFVEKTEERGGHVGMIAGSATVSSCENNYWLDDSYACGGIDGAIYGSESNYAAAAVKAEHLMCEGMLSDRLSGLDADKWLAGETEPRYPVPRALTEIEQPELYGDKSAFDSAAEKAKEDLTSLSDSGSRTVVTVTFYTYDFDSESHERAAIFRLHKGEGIEESKIPNLVEDDGYFVGWDRTDFSCFDESTGVYELVDKAKFTIAADDSDTPLALVEGKFYGDTVLALRYNGEYISPEFTCGGEKVSYGSVTVKYYVGDGINKTKIKLVRGAEMKDAETTVWGKYLAFTLEEGWEFALVKETADLTWLYITLAAVGGALVAATPFVVVITVKRKKKLKKETDTFADTAK